MGAVRWQVPSQILLGNYCYVLFGADAGRTAILMKVFSSTSVYFHSFTYSLILVSLTSSYLASCAGYDLQSSEMSSTQTPHLAEMGKVWWFCLVL